MRPKSSGQTGVGRRSPAGWQLLGVTLAVCLVPVTTQAHTAIQGMGEIASGLLHPLLTPPHLLVLLALGFLLGQQRPLRLARPAAAFAVAAALGILWTTTGAVKGVLTPVLMLLALPVGALVALARPLPGAVRLALCAAAALALGLDSGVDPGTATVPAVKTLMATWASLLLAWSTSRSTSRCCRRSGGCRPAYGSSARGSSPSRC